MEFFSRARAVRLRSYHDKYLTAEEDEEHVYQDRHGTSGNARWTVERVSNADHVIRLRSCYGRYLTASNEPVRLGVAGKKVLQTLPSRLDSSLEWEPVRQGNQAKLKTRYGNYLRGNSRLPPWRNSVTHDIPHRSSTQDWILWDVEVVEILPNLSAALVPVPTPEPQLEVRTVDGRSVYFTIADDAGNVDDSVEWPKFTFIGTSVPELTQKLKQETELDDIIVCTRNPSNQRLLPLYLHLPPNSTTLRLVVVDANSNVATNFI